MLFAYKSKPGHRKSWPGVEEDIKRFAENNKNKMPNEVYLSIYQFSDKILYNFASRGTRLKPNVIYLLYLFFQSEMFLAQVPYARDIIQRRERTIEDGRTVARYIGGITTNSNQDFSGFSGYWISIPQYLEDLAGKYTKEERPDLHEDETKKNIVLYREVLKIEHPYNEPFAIIHCYRQILDLIFDKDEKIAERDLSVDHTHWHGYENRHLGVLSGYILIDEKSGQFSAYIYSRFSGKFAFDFAINNENPQTIMFDYKDHDSVQAIKLYYASPSHPSVAGIGKILGESYAGPLTHDQFFADHAYSTREISQVFAKIRESVIIDE